jgi:hypothetical protein
MAGAVPMEGHVEGVAAEAAEVYSLPLVRAAVAAAAQWAATVVPTVAAGCSHRWAQAAAVVAA